MTLLTCNPWSQAIRINVVIRIKNVYTALSHRTSMLGNKQVKRRVYPTQARIRAHGRTNTEYTRTMDSIHLATLLLRTKVRRADEAGSPASTLEVVGCTELPGSLRLLGKQTVRHTKMLNECLTSDENRNTRSVAFDYYLSCVARTHDKK